MVQLKLALVVVVVGLLVAACSGDAPAIEPQAPEARESPTATVAATAETPTVTPALTIPLTPTPAPTPTITPVLAIPTTPTPTSTPTVTTDGYETESDLSLLVYSGGPYVTPVYDREEWRHWIDEDGDCQDTRQEVLIEESVGLVSYTDSRQCRVASGVWTGPYTGEEFTDPGELDVDHMVPLAEAHSSGGWTWSEAKKRQYANDLSYEGHLVAVRASANRSKGSDGPSYWKPPDRSYWCQYAVDWIKVKHRWELFASEGEAAALIGMLKTCTPTRTFTLIPFNIPLPAGTPTATPIPEESYGSCDAAEEAGEPRVLGNKGTGRGFPQDKVPSARDGDGDGVVCER